VTFNGILNQHIEINEIKMEDIGNYCCYGYDERKDSKFLACFTLALLGNHTKIGIYFILRVIYQHHIIENGSHISLTG